jgi:hypothetical protein
MNTTERAEAREKVNFWDGELRTATTKERIDLCREQLKEARHTYDGLIAQATTNMTAARAGN